jgi:hypothetical protein
MFEAIKIGGKRGWGERKSNDMKIFGRDNPFLKKARLCMSYLK